MTKKELEAKLKFSEDIINDLSGKIELLETENKELKQQLDDISKGQKTSVKKAPALPSPFELDGVLYEFQHVAFRFNSQVFKADEIAQAPQQHKNIITSLIASQSPVLVIKDK